MQHKKGRIVSNKEVKPGYYLMSVDCPSVARAAKPGQFLTIRCSRSTEPLLRRPFGFHRICGSGFEILYEVVGGGTRALSGMRPDDTVDILGPLGNGFSVPAGKKDFVIIAGGIGVAPLAALAEELSKDRKKNISVIIGARSKSALLCREHFERLGLKTMVATDDGSCGKKCFATDVLDEFLAIKRVFVPILYACGPGPMIKAVGRVSKKRGLQAYASFEENIACGVGACLGCAIRTRNGYKLVCKDGPVFDLKEIIC
jgi:dihydroorotate dehydrogenase electron transfer subunit